MKKEEATQDPLLQRMDRIINKLEGMENRIDNLLKHIEEFNRPAKILTTVNDGPMMFRKKASDSLEQESNIMKKFNEFMLKKDPRNEEI